MVLNILDLIIHMDKYISLLLQQYGIFFYAIVFLIIFAETGLVIAPLLPGDSLLFVLGAFAAKGDLNLFAILIILSIAAILGDSFNYWAGKYFSKIILGWTKIVKQEHLDKTKEFYQQHGGKTIIIARFLPIVRTFAPFIAGMGKMFYRKFLFFNIIGGLAWVLLFVLGGFFFGTIPIVQKNFTLVIFLIIMMSFVPAIYEIVKQKIKKHKHKSSKT